MDQINLLPTKDNLYRRNILANTDILRSFSCDIVKNQEHLFFQCNYYDQLWHLTTWLLGIILYHRVVYKIILFGLVV